MITKMKKLTFLVYHKEYETFLNGVRDLGVVHVAEKQQGQYSSVWSSADDRKITASFKACQVSGN